ncbi:MAG: DUF1080 domain-containing protein, partial [Candidatus Brocadiaceae bacterium]
MRLILVSLVVLCWAVWLGAAGIAAETDAAEGYVSIFNGEDLTDWDGDPRLWSVQDGVIRGQTTEENPARGNTFCVWKGGTLKDFALKIQFRIQNGNSGIQYRSKVFGEWRVGGYQAEVCNQQGKVGFLYHEAARGWLVNVGDFMIIDAEGEKNVVGNVSDVEAIKEAGYYKEQDWNEYTIIAQGNYIRHYLNGYPTIALIDNDRVTDPADANDRRGAAREGILALQIHQGPPMVVEFRDIRLKQLDSNYGSAVRLFNGTDLEGWVPSSDACKDTFGVADGVITNTGKPAGYLRTTADHTNYTLHLQLRHVSAGNSGVLLRMVGEDKVWPKSIEAQGMSGAMGDIWNIDKVVMTVAEDRTRGRNTKKMHPSNERPIGEWNDYEMTLDGGDLEIKVN